MDRPAHAMEGKQQAIKMGSLEPVLVGVEARRPCGAYVLVLRLEKAFLIRSLKRM